MFSCDVYLAYLHLRHTYLSQELVRRISDPKRTSSSGERTSFERLGQV